MSCVRRAPLALLGVLAAVAAAGLLFSSYMVYDDEGYVLYSLQCFVDGGGLYERVYSQYGPFFYLFHQVLSWLGLPFTSDGARILTWFNWTGATLLCGIVAWRLARSTATTALAAGGVLLHLESLTKEPSHPGGFVVFAVALLAWLGTRWISQPSRLAAAAGVVGAALVLTKINVGIFALLGAGAWWLLHLDSPRMPLKVRAGIVGFLLAVVPFALMSRKLALDWVATFATVSAAAGVAVTIAAAKGARPVTSWANLLALGAGLGAVALGTAAAIVAQGTSLHGLVEGVVFGPLRHPDAYMHNVRWRPGAFTFALISLGLAGWAAWKNSPAVRRLIAVARLVAVAAFVVTYASTLPLNPLAFAMSYALATSWLFVFPLDPDAPSQPARTWLALLAIPQALHAYPVAGSQVAWGTFLWVPLAVIGAHEAVKFLVMNRAGFQRSLVRWGAVGIIALALARTGNATWIGVQNLRNSDSPKLPGTALLRLPENLATTLRVLALNSRTHADLLFTLPGMLSFHRWTGVPPPTSLNTTHWFTLLTPAQQEEIRGKLEAAPRSCLIVQRGIYDFLVRTQIATESPLTLWLKSNYHPVFALDSYEFWVRNGRNVAALGTATVRVGAPGVTPRYLVSATLTLPPAEEIATVELGIFDGDVATIVKRWAAGEIGMQFTPLDAAGAELAPTQPLLKPLPSSALGRVGILTDDFPAGLALDRTIVIFRNRAGARIAEARFVP